MENKYKFLNPTAEFNFNSLTPADIQKYLADPQIREKSRSKKIKTISEIQKKWNLTDSALFTIKAILHQVDNTYWKRKIAA